NLTEVTGYAGILPLVAAFALLARLPVRGLVAWMAPRRLTLCLLARGRGARARRGGAAPSEAAMASGGGAGGGPGGQGGGGARGGRARAGVPDWLVWHVMALVGVALALGGNTPLGSVLAQLPFYGTQRLQSRNILVLDVALAVLLAYWADDPFPERVRR